MTETQLVSTDDGVLAGSGAARAEGRAALDTEFMREKTYRAKLCLVQVATSDRIVLIDPMSGVDLGPIAELIADENVEVVVHAGRQDFELFAEGFGVAPTRVYDVQLAAGFAGYGSSLPYGRLVEETTGTALEKGESYTDWCKRPLTRSQIGYAAADVRHLLAVAEHLKHRIAELGRSEWVAEEMAALEGAEPYVFNPGAAWLRVSGRGSLNGRQTAVLREVARWREEAAERRDIPRGWVIKDVTLVEIARRMPATAAALKSIRGMNAREVERSGREILAAIEAGRSGAPVVRPPAPSRAALARARMLSGLADALVKSRCEEAGVASELVATRSELDALLVDGHPDGSGHRLLRGWRKDVAGDDVVDLISGRVALKVVDEPPFVKEIRL